jgi:hypothetical protein
MSTLTSTQIRTVLEDYNITKFCIIPSAFRSKAQLDDTELQLKFLKEVPVRFGQSVEPSVELKRRPGLQIVPKSRHFDAILNEILACVTTTSGRYYAL